MTDLDKLCADLRGMMEKATPGPWSFHHRCVGLEGIRPGDEGAPDAINGLGWDWDENGHFPEEPMRGIVSKAADAALIEFARNDLETLLDALTALQAERDRYRDGLLAARDAAKSFCNDEGYEVATQVNRRITAALSDRRGG